MTDNVTSGKEIEITLHQILSALSSQVNYYFLKLNFESFIKPSKLLQGPSFKTNNFSKTQHQALGVA
jgi:hypothetical protein